MAWLYLYLNRPSYSHNMKAFYNGELEGGKQSNYNTWRLRLPLAVAVVLSADAGGGARFVDIGARLEGVAGVVDGIVGEPLAALGCLRANSIG